MTPSSRSIGVYGSGLFQDTNMPYAEQPVQIQASTFTMMVLWALRVQPGGDF